MKLLENLYNQYNIAQLRGGRRTDALGDLYESFVKGVFIDVNRINRFNKKTLTDSLEDKLFSTTLADYNLNYIYSVVSLSIPKRENGSSPKTDVALLLNESIVLKISVKQSVAHSVTAAEFSVDTISKEVGISDSRLLMLMEKHQQDASAKKFTSEEKEYLTQGMTRLKERFVRWVVSGSAVPTTDIRIANHTIMFMLNKQNLQIRNFSSHSVTRQIKKITSRKSGFGTGLSWTYATGTKGRKIQFKCPVE